MILDIWNQLTHGYQAMTKPNDTNKNVEAIVESLTGYPASRGNLRNNNKAALCEYMGIYISSCLLVILLCVGLLLVIPVTSYADSNQIDHIRQLYQTVNSNIENGKANMIYYFTDDDGYSVNTWEVAKSVSERSYSKAPIKAVTYYINKDIIKAVFFFKSLVGDWDYTSEHYFKSGNVLFIFEKTVTFQGYDEKDDKLSGPFIFEKRRYYNKKGKEIRYLEKTFHYKTKKEVNPNHVRAMEFKLYRKSNDLPFVDILHEMMNK